MNVNKSGDQHILSGETTALVDRFTYFNSDISQFELPEKFTFPFYYEPHQLSRIAATELQEYLKTQSDWEHNFGLEKDQNGLVIGKMFGVLVVRNQQNELGYLAAFSGKLAGSNHHNRFVPPVFDILEKDGFFRQGEEILNGINRRIETLEQLPELIALKALLHQQQTQAEGEINQQKLRIKAAKKERDLRRKTAQEQSPDPETQLRLQEELAQESLQEKFLLKDMTKYWLYTTSETKEKIAAIESEIQQLKEERKQRSASLQQQIFDEYFFLNVAGKKKSLGAVFADSLEMKPPAGAGECAAPKLLQYAFIHGLEPIALAEFWWGQSPTSEIRKHAGFYPACRGKCEPILAHMLDGIETDPNPMLINPAEGKEITIVYEDEYLLVINKPAEFLSVPGKNIVDSVYERIRARYPEATGPLIVHRLDMSTSGLIVLAKNKDIHKHLQSQFIRRHVKKRYVALLSGTVDGESGIIDLPLRVDLDDRPRQLVCYEYGKPAQTRWEVVERSNGNTRIHFYPITGRTHQLRVHSAHPLGLNAPIIGDDLYGIKANRLHLHAEQLEFTHPVTRETLIIQIDARF